MRFTKLYSGFVILILVLSACSVSRTEITVKELQNHISYLASDSLKGRMTGSTGDSLAADYIRNEFEKYGLIPLVDNGFQSFKVTEKIIAGKENSLTVNGFSFVRGEDFTPVSISENGSVSAEVVFAGYGFRISNDSLKWNDYLNEEVTGKWVMMLRSDPEPDNQNSPFAPYSSDRNKAMVAKDLGAAGVLLVSGQAFDNSDTFDPLAKGSFSVGIPVIRIKRKVADEILKNSGQTINSLESRILKSKQALSPVRTAVIVDGRTEILNYLTNTRNVLMMLPGEDPGLKEEYILLGAHFDHLGLGGEGSGSRAVDTIGVHHGADDNASGVALIIELAGKFAGTKSSHKRSLIFAAFSGEELGLFGSKYYTENPVIDISKLDLMANFDMVGRLKESRELQIGGVGTADSLKEKTTVLNDTTLLKISFTEEGSGSSDHSSFYSKNIPVLFFFTGAHDDYHKPADTPEKINYKGMLAIGDLAFSLLSDIADDKTRLVFREAGPKEDPNRPPRRRGITLGIMPDVSGSSKNGLRVEAVTQGKPASIGGMKKGDIIIGIDGKPVNNIGDYMFRMGQVKKGDRITVDVIRNDKKEVLLIQL